MKRIIVGVIIVMLGVFLLFYNLGFVSYPIYHLVISWKSLLIAIGAVLLFDKTTHNKNAGLILISIGIVFLLPKIFSIPGNFVFPVLVIGFGVYFVIRAIRRRNNPDNSWKKDPFFINMGNGNFSETSTTEDGKVKRDYIFTGSKEKWTLGEVKNIEISAAFSGVELDFTQTELSAEEEKIYIKVTSVFGGVTLYVPEDWNILINKTGVFGGWSDNRPKNQVRHLGGKLVIMELEAVFGGGEIKCYE